MTDNLDQLKGENIAKLADMRASGALTEEQYQRNVARILAATTTERFGIPPTRHATPSPATRQRKARRIVWGVVSAVVLLVIILIAVSAGGPKPSYRVSNVSATAASSSTLDVYFYVANVGKATGTPVCQISAAVTVGSATIGNMIWDSTLDPVAPGHTEIAAMQTLTIPDNDAGMVAMNVANGSVAIKCS